MSRNLELFPIFDVDVFGLVVGCSRVLVRIVVLQDCLRFCFFPIATMLAIECDQ